MEDVLCRATLISYLLVPRLMEVQLSTTNWPIFSYLAKHFEIITALLTHRVLFSTPRIRKAEKNHIMELQVLSQLEINKT